ncbi:MAG TPA: 23S rRNA (guanosine(2251)-2'-O)-methyltransferase RlmB [Motilibacteraceae bacterium]|nr:23S rRNA (guanosine(2251)-2'-O)-methyltransferase RlmB [Motilibacteraceae bacterium]
MAGNSQRRGAKRNPGSKKGATVGSGGQRRRALKPKGPTPRAEERTGHPAARRAAAAARRADRPGGSRPARGQAKEGAETVAGRNPVVEALRAGVPATALYVAVRIDSDERVKEAITLATERGIALLEAPKPELDRLAGAAVHQGLVLHVPPYSYLHPDDLVERAQDADEVPLVVALDGVTDPRNLGAVVRSVAAFGGHGVVVPERRAAGMTASAWRTSAGTAARVPVARATNLTRALESYKEQGLFVVGLDADGDASVDKLDLADGPLVLVIGSEGKGLSRLVRETCDVVASIPMAPSSATSGGAESLNAGVAAGIALYAVSRARAAQSS